MIKAFVFDLGGVIVSYHGRIHYEYISKTFGLSKDKVEKIVEKGIVGIESGAEKLNAFEKRVCSSLNITARDFGWMSFYKKNMRINDELASYIKKLHKHYKTAFLSNVDFARYRYTRNLLDLNSFDYKFTSCYMHLRKPDPKIYRKVAEKMLLKPYEIVFIDDRKQNVIGAKSIGMNAIQYFNFAQFKKEADEIAKR